MGFFVLAIFATASGVSPLYAGLKALAGAVVLYLATKAAAGLVVNIMVDAIIRTSSQNDNAERNSTENAR